MKRWMLTLTALGLTAGLALLWPGLGARKEETRQELRVTRVWIAEKEPAVAAWLRGQAAGFEKQTGARLYLRGATEAEADAALRGESGLVAPDLIISSEGENCVALRGYALICRDEAAPVWTPAATGMLFFRPSPTPGPSPAPAPTPDSRALAAVLVPAELQGALPGAILSQNPAAELASGRARAALLTAGQAAGLSFGYQAYALPEGAGLVKVGAAALSEPGRLFLHYLQDAPAQRALAAHGLYSPSLKLYTGDDPLRALIEESLPLSDRRF